MNQRTLTGTKIIKGLSIILMTGAIGFELWNRYTGFSLHESSTLVRSLVWLERFAVTAHFTEGLIAAFYALSKQKNPIRSGIYTFFVGTIGLFELFNAEKAAIASNKS